MNRNYFLVRCFFYKVVSSTESMCLLSTYSVREQQKKVSVIKKIKAVYTFEGL